MRLPYNKNLAEKAKELRKNSTLSEVLLWNKLKNRQFHGIKFIRQKPILDYIVDFYSPDLKPVIEIDGISHADKEEYDEEREKRLKELGLTVVRFSDKQVKNNMYGVLLELEEYVR